MENKMPFLGIINCRDFWKIDYHLQREATSSLASAYKSFPGLRDHEWEGKFNSPNEIYVAVFLKDSQDLVASASFQKFDTDTIEFGFDVAEAYRNPLKDGITEHIAGSMISFMI